MKIATTLAALLAITFVAACGGGGGGDDDDDVDSGIVLDPDAAPGDPDAAPVACTTPATHGAVTGTNLGATADAAANPNQMAVDLQITSDTAFDVLEIQLYKGFGAFTKGEIVAGTYQITGDELNFSTCGVCPLIFTDFDGSATVDTYLATGGTVTITSVSPNLTGSVSNLTFEHVDIDMTTFVSTPNASGCQSAITSAAFDSQVTVQGGP